MSSKSDNDNHSNQLNPNNDEYWHSRDSGVDDDDDGEPARHRLPLPWRETHSVREAGTAQYVIAAVAFSGHFLHVRFQVNWQRSLGNYTGTRPDNIAQSVADMVARELRNESPHGIAYQRMGRDQDRGTFTWFTPQYKESRMPASEPGESVDLLKARAWYGGLRELAARLEHHFDMQDHASAVNLGLIERELT